MHLVGIYILEYREDISLVYVVLELFWSLWNNSLDFSFVRSKLKVWLRCRPHPPVGASVLLWPSVRKWTFCRIFMKLSSKCDFHDSSVDSETVINVKANFLNCRPFWVQDCRENSDVIPLSNQQLPKNQYSERCSLLRVQKSFFFSFLILFHPISIHFSRRNAHEVFWVITPFTELDFHKIRYKRSAHNAAQKLWFLWKSA